MYIQRRYTQITADTFLQIRIRAGNFPEAHICRTVNRTRQKHLQNRSPTNKGISESSRDCVAISVTLSNHCLL
jgi:hypothetical protein